jgi:hypothetical membrane protein
MHSATSRVAAASVTAEPARERLRVSSALATVVFWAALLVFGALRPGYSQFTKAVSELGAIGSPYALAWNLVGFILPGLLLARGGARIASALDRPRGGTWWALVLTGLAFAGTGVFPAVIVNGTPAMRAPLTVGHIIMMMASSGCWLVALVLLIRRVPQWMRPVMLALTCVAVAGLAANVFHDLIPLLAYRPGLAQRLGFAGFFAWYVGMSSLTSAVPARRLSSKKLVG